MAESWPRFCIAPPLPTVESRASVPANTNKLPPFSSNILVAKLPEMEKVPYWWVPLISIPLAVLVWRAAPLFWTISVALPLSLTVSVPPSLIFVFIASPLAETVCIPPSLIVVSFATPSTICSPPVSVVPVAVAFVLTISRPPILTCVLSEEVSDSTVNTPPFASRILSATWLWMENAPSLFVPLTVVPLVLVFKIAPSCWVTFVAVPPLTSSTPPE